VIYRLLAPKIHICHDFYNGRKKKYRTRGIIGTVATRRHESMSIPFVMDPQQRTSSSPTPQVVSDAETGDQATEMQICDRISDFLDSKKCAASHRKWNGKGSGGQQVNISAAH
jgi:hypothetical protein